MTKFSCSIQIGDQLPWPEVFPVFASAGCGRVNLPGTGGRGAQRLSDPAETASLARELRDHGLAIDWIHGPYRWPELYHGQRGRRTLALAAHLHWLRQAAELSARTYVMHPFYGPEFPQPDPADAFEHLRDAFGALAREGRRLGVAVAVENLQYGPCNGYTERLLNEVPELGFCFDVGHSALNRDRERWLPAHASRLAALHLHDNRGTLDDHLFPGEGVTDWREWVTFLGGVGYTGAWGLEVHAPADVGDRAEEVGKRLSAALARFREWLVFRNS